MRTMKINDMNKMNDACNLNGNYENCTYIS